MKLLGEKVDNLAFFVMVGLLVFGMWLPSRLLIDNETKALIALVVAFAGSSVILWTMLTQREGS